LYVDGKRLWIAEARGQGGGLWTWQNGQLLKTTFNAGAVNAVSGSDLEVWAGTRREGTFLLNIENTGLRIYEHLTSENTAGGLRSNNILAIFQDHDGIVWFGTDRGVCRYDRTSFRNSQVSPVADSNFVRALLHTQKNGTWCGTNRGLFLLAGRTKETNYDSWIEIPELEGLSIYALSEDSAGAIWAGTNAGLFVRTDASSNFNRVHSANTVVSIGEENPEDHPSQPTPPVEGENKLAPGPGVGNESPQPPPPATQPRGRVLALANFRGHLYAAFFDR